MEIYIHEPKASGIAVSEIIRIGAAAPHQFPGLSRRQIGIIRQVSQVECDAEVPLLHLIDLCVNTTPTLPCR